MPRTEQYDLGFGWATRRPHVFTDLLEALAKRRRLRWIRILPDEIASARRRIQAGSLKVKMFLNTQADGSNMESPAMMLCRALKAAGSLVVEDPDDAHVYADRALQFEYLRRAGLTVPKHVLIENWQPDQARFSAAQRGTAGGTWIARPAVGMNTHTMLRGSGRLGAAALARGSFRRGEDILVQRHSPPTTDNRRPQFRMWYLFGEIVAGLYNAESDAIERIDDEHPFSHMLPSVMALVHKLHEISGLDWFCTDILGCRRSGARRQLQITEPANALAGFGPGIQALAELPEAVAGTAARRLVEVAWRHARGRPVRDGTVLQMI